MQDEGVFTSITVTPNWSFQVPYQSKDGRKTRFMAFFMLVRCGTNKANESLMQAQDS